MPWWIFCLKGWILTKCLTGWLNAWEREKIFGSSRFFKEFYSLFLHPDLFRVFSCVQSVGKSLRGKGSKGIFFNLFSSPSWRYLDILLRTFLFLLEAFFPYLHTTNCNIPVWDKISIFVFSIVYVNSLKILKLKKNRKFSMRRSNVSHDMRVTCFTFQFHLREN